MAGPALPPAQVLPIPVVSPYLGAASSWEPGPEVKLHNGGPIPPTMDFFEPPPGEIGPILSAYSTLKKGQSGAIFQRNLAIAAGTAVGVGLLGGIIGWAASGKLIGGVVLFTVGTVVIGGPAALILMFVLHFKHSLTYVGELGVCEMVIVRRGKIKSRDTFLFASAVDLYTSQTRRYYNGIYHGTDYNYTWKDAAGKRVFRDNGKYYSADGNPKASSSYHFACAAERAWSALLLKVVAQEFETEGSVLFRVNKKDSVRVGLGFLEFHFGGKQQRITLPEIGKLSLDSGTFHVHHKDARWFSGQGKFSFNYGGMANARLFLMCLDKLCGYRLS